MNLLKETRLRTPKPTIAVPEGLVTAISDSQPCLVNGATLVMVIVGRFDGVESSKSIGQQEVLIIEDSRYRWQTKWKHC